MQETKSFQMTSLMVAAARGRCDLIRQFLDAGQPVDVRDPLGRTALFYAVASGHKQAALDLVRAGANPYAADHSGESPSSLSERLAGRSMVRQLMDELPTMSVTYSPVAPAVS